MEIFKGIYGSIDSSNFLKHKALMDVKEKEQ